jgi:hypothetical protein
LRSTFFLQELNYRKTSIKSQASNKRWFLLMAGHASHLSKEKPVSIKCQVKKTVITGTVGYACAALMEYHSISSLP